MGWDWLKKTGRLLTYTSPIAEVALPGIGQAIVLAEEIVENIKQPDSDIVISGEAKENIALSQLIKLIDNATGDHLTDKQEVLARKAFQANLAFINSLETNE